MITIGNSGFGYTTTTEKDHRGYKNYTHLRIYNIKTKEEIFYLKGGYSYGGRGTSAIKSSLNPSKRFLGLDNKYYYIEVLQNNKINWGQIQSDGAVLRSDRTILKIISFFPHYKDPTTAVPPTSPIIVKEPSNIPKVVVIPPAPVKTPILKEDVSWIQKIINWIIMILNR